MNIAFALMTILFLAISSQWIAWKLKLPAILFLLLSGILFGPLSEFFTPNHTILIEPSLLLGNDLLYPLISLSVAIILFEGSMSLRLDDIKDIGRVVRNLVTFGIMITALLTCIATRYIFHFPWGISALIGSITCVSGPTVIVPILRSVRPTKKLSNIIKWEGMLIDPLGALLAALVFTGISSFSQFQAIRQILEHIVIIIILGVAAGALFGYFLGLVLRRHLVPDYLSNLFALTCVVVNFVISESIVEGGGLLSVTVMGVFIANVKDTNIHHVMDFKEHLSLLLISVLFIVLAANINFKNLEIVLLPSLLLILFIQLIIRPVVVFLCTYKSNLNWREKVLLGWIAPRGIVVAAVAALFSVKLLNQASIQFEYASYAKLLSLVVFLIIIGTVTISSLTAPLLARFLNVSLPDPRGFLIVGANKFAIKVGLALQNQGLMVVLADINWKNVQRAKLAGLNSYYGNSASEHADWKMDMVGIGRMLGLSNHDQINMLSAVKYHNEFGSNTVFLLPSFNRRSIGHFSGLSSKYSKYLFSETYTYEVFSRLIDNGATLKTTKLTDEFCWDHYQDKYQGRYIPLFLIDSKGCINVISSNPINNIIPGYSIIALISDAPLSRYV